MSNNLNLINKLEKGRAEFAYNCVSGLKKLNVEESKYHYFYEGLENFKKEVIESFKKQINEEKIRKILNEIEYHAANKDNLSEKEREVIAKYNSLLNNFRSYVRKIPQMIISNGLGQTLAFVFAKKKNGNAYDLIYRQITDYLKSDATARIRMPNNQNELIKWVISLNSYEYRHVTEEILAFLNWLRRFAEGMIETEEEE
ncbi:MAG: type III-B CRISPR module-associated protein Cmr5 [candidate division WOR-3 bacterium]|nr:type III-B CRISPR module-associated protein Cmr5 [candidate division WOR-3 bacterium]MDW8150855.1 type III-B CRISPR module-associated protein Cmr5 [candidate division WOR-3 bacterium]